MMEDSLLMDKDEKAAYNQSKNITDILGTLLGAYVFHMNKGDLPQATDAIDRVHDIISPKIKKEEITIVDKMVDIINPLLPVAMETYEFNSRRYFRHLEIRNKVKRMIKILFRTVNKLQDKYGYGMISLDDPRLAVLQR